MNTDLRPRRSAINPKPMQPANMPAKVENTKKPMPRMSNNPVVLFEKIPLEISPGAM